MLHHWPGVFLTVIARFLYGQPTIRKIDVKNEPHLPRT